MKIDHEIVSREDVARETDRSVGKRKAICLFLAFVCALFGICVAHAAKSRESELAMQDAQIAELKGELAALEKPDAGSPTDGSAENEKEDGRDRNDPKIAGEFLKKLLSWESYDDYAGIRKWLRTEYGVSKKDDLLTAFMPSVDERTFGGANMKFQKATAYVVCEEDGAISYFAICEVSNKVDGNAGTGRVGVFYTIDEGGNLGGVSAYVLVR